MDKYQNGRAECPDCGSEIDDTGTCPVDGRRAREAFDKDYPIR